MHSLENITKFLNNKDFLSQDKLDKSFELLYPEVKKIANAQIARIIKNSEVTPTLLVNECYLKLKKSVNVDLKNRQHFFSLVARCMRFFLIDLIRKQYNIKSQIITKFSITQISADNSFEIELIELDRAFNKLEKIDAELLNIVELRFFGGFSLDEIADFQGSSTSSVYRQWLMAKSILINFIEEKDEKP